MSSMHSYLDARWLKDLALDPDYSSPPTAEQQAAFDVYAAARDEYLASERDRDNRRIYNEARDAEQAARARGSWDADYGLPTAHPMDPRTSDDADRDAMIAQIDEAELALTKARALIEDAGPSGSLLAGRSLMVEAIGWLQDDGA